MDNIISVSDLNKTVKVFLDTNPVFNNFLVEGEISSLRDKYSSGHIYFTLKDNSASVSAIMFKQYAKNLNFILEEGKKVLVKGRPSIYEKDGRYQLIVYDIKEVGIGNLSQKFELLKQKLQNEGLFDEKHKKPLPKRPGKIVAVTSGEGAAIHDIINVLKRRYPLCCLEIYSVPVQGEKAAEKITNAINKLDKNSDADLIIVGRGGGSYEDLFCFNDENLARAIFNCHIPIISAVGHEVDFTISDFVADKRAATPTAAAEIAVPDINDELTKLRETKLFFDNFIQSKIENLTLRLSNYKNHRLLSSPEALINEKFMRLDIITKNLISATEKIIGNKNLGFSKLVSQMKSLDPKKIMSRGYAFVKKQDKVIKSVDEIDSSDKLNLIMYDGEITVSVDEKRKNNE